MFVASNIILLIQSKTNELRNIFTTVSNFQKVCLQTSQVEMVLNYLP